MLLVEFGANDPANPADPSLIANFLWAVTSHPADADPNLFQITNPNQSLFNFYAPIAGHYVVGLTVWNTSGIQSGGRAPGKVRKLR